MINIEKFLTKKASVGKPPDVFLNKEISIPPDKNLYFKQLQRFIQWRNLIGKDNLWLGISSKEPKDVKKERKREEDEIRKIYLQHLDRNLYLLLGHKNYSQFLEYFQVRSYREFLEKLNSLLPPMDKNCRVVVILPSRLEGKNIERVLEGYTRQVDNKKKPLNQSLFEIIVLVNRRKDEEDDDTEEKIEEFCRKHPETKVRIVKIVFPENENIANVGMCRKIISDLAILRSQKNILPLYFITEDADTIFVDPTIIYKTIKSFDAKYFLDALRGQERRDPNILKEIPVLLFKLQSDAAISILLKQGRKKQMNVDDFTNNEIFRWSRIITGGWATAFTAEVLMKIGGYLPVKIGEDLSIGELISLLRGDVIETKEWGNIIKPNNSTVQFFGVKSIGSARRFVSVLLEKIKTAYSSEFGSKKEIQVLRDIDFEKILEEIKKKNWNMINEETLKMIEDDLSSKRRFLLDVLGKNDGERMFQRLMIIVLGFKKKDYQLEKDQVKIVNRKRLKQIFYTFRLRLWLGQKYGAERKTEVFGLPVRPDDVAKLENLVKNLTK